jgi:hypothetical protein
MKIGIDISQIAYQNTGVANHVKNLVEHLGTVDTENKYVLFYSSLRKDLPPFVKTSNMAIKQFKFPFSGISYIFSQ